MELVSAQGPPWVLPKPLFSPSSLSSLSPAGEGGRRGGHERGSKVSKGNPELPEGTLKAKGCKMGKYANLKKMNRGLNNTQLMAKWAKLIKAGIVKEPEFWPAMQRMPPYPQAFTQRGTLQEIVFPEDELFKVPHSPPLLPPLSPQPPLPHKPRAHSTPPSLFRTMTPHPKQRSRRRAHSMSQVQPPIRTPPMHPVPRPLLKSCVSARSGVHEEKRGLEGRGCQGP
jgi:hypothetical protein